MSGTGAALLADPDVRAAYLEGGAKPPTPVTPPRNRAGK